MTAGKTAITRKGLFHNQDGSIRIALVLTLVAVPLLISGQWLFGSIVLGVGSIASLLSVSDQIKEEDKQEIRYNVMDADDVVKELMLLEAKRLKEKGESSESFTCDPRPQDNNPQIQQIKIHFMAGLNALAKKWSNEQQKKQNDHLTLLCQQATYVSLRMYPLDDNVLTAAFSLHALVAKHQKVRQRHLFAADEYGLDQPVQCMQKALDRAREVDNNTDKEQDCAELQRKACLLLGALSDGDSDIATKIVDEDGITAILNALKWYRFHEDVANWGLWALFILCYENPPNKSKNVQLGGIPVVLQTMKNIIGCEEVARHGIAILFDHMREEELGQHPVLFDVWQVRKSALNAGLHDVIFQAMNSFRHSFQIIMMGREILVGTNYPGQIPEYEAAN